MTTITLAAAGDFIDWLKKMKPFISTEETRYYLNGIFFTEDQGTLYLIATDGHRLIRVKTFAECPEGLAVIVPKDLIATIIAAKGVSRIDPVTITFTEKLAEFDFGYIKLSGKLIDGTYPDYKRVIPEGKNDIHQQVAFNAKYLIDVCKVFGSEKLTFSGDGDPEKSPTLITADLGVTVVLMPMRI